MNQPMNPLTTPPATQPATQPANRAAQGQVVAASPRVHAMRSYLRPTSTNMQHRFDPYEAPERVRPIYASANAILNDTPIPDWFNLPVADVLDLAFPDWSTIAIHDGTPEQRKQIDPYAVLRHRTHRDRWMVLLGYYTLLPGHGGSTGHFFRFKYHSNNNLAVVGTVDELITGLKKWRHSSSWQHTPYHVAQAIAAAMTNTDTTDAETGPHADDETALTEATRHVAAIDLIAALTADPSTLTTLTTPGDSDANADKSQP